MKKPDTKYDLEKYLEKRKKDEADKEPRPPSGFMKKQREEKARIESKKPR